MLSPKVWAKQFYSETNLGDKRRTKRLVNVAATLAAKPLNSFCQSYETLSETKGAYRLIENNNVPVKAIQDASTKATVNTCKGLPVILAVADTRSNHHLCC